MDPYKNQFLSGIPLKQVKDLPRTAQTGHRGHIEERRQSHKGLTQYEKGMKNTIHTSNLTGPTWSVERGGILFVSFEKISLY